MGVLDKVRKFKDSRPKNTGDRSRTRGIFHDWLEAENNIRLVGEFLETKTHFLAPVPKRKERGLCPESSFEKNNDGSSLPKVVNCPDWDLDKEQDSGKKVCPVCKLMRIAKQALKEQPNDEEKKYFEALLNVSRPRTNLKWNIFDRDNPNVTVIDENGNETQQKGLKIATIGMEAWNDIEGIFEQCGIDITDPNEGVDIVVKKGKNATRVEYSAQVKLDGKGVKETPFDKEELSIIANNHDLKSICGRLTDPNVILDGLHGDYRELLDLNDDSSDDEPAKPAKSAKNQKGTSERNIVDPDDEEYDVDTEDEDALLSTKKK